MRTVLTIDGKKIGGPVRGAAIKLSDDADVTAGLVIGERLETTLAGMVFGFNTTDKASLSVRPEWLAQQSCYREVDFCSRTATSL
jgi:hypothetical protein